MQAAVPTSFGKSPAIYHPAQGRCGVLLCSPWGFDELCSRKFYRLLGEALAEAGLPALRFDYPGTVDAADPVKDASFEAWVDAAGHAADHLKSLSGCQDIIVLGLGIGATVAFLLAQKRADITAQVLAAPVTSGRRYLRETALRAQVINDGLGLFSNQLPAGVSIGGFRMDEAVASGIKATNLEKVEISRPIETLLIQQEAVGPNSSIAQALVEAGAAVDEVPFSGYEALMENPSISVVPVDVLDTITKWCGDLKQSANGASEANEAAAVTPWRIDEPEFIEEGIFLRDEAPVFGVYCKPKIDPRGPIVVLVNTSYDHHGGWSRLWVRIARDLAHKGISSFRCDLPNIGDSPARKGEPDQVLYTQGQIDDVKDVVEYLHSKTGQDSLLVGRCSGAYSAYHAGASNSHVGGMVLINMVRFYWDADESVDALLQAGPRALSDYKKRAFNVRTFKRLFSGDINVAGVLRGLSVHARNALVNKLANVLPIPTQLKRDRKACLSVFEDLERRQAKTVLACSVGDESLDLISRYFGNDLRDLSRFPGLNLVRVPNADHNMTPEAAQLAICEIVAEQALALSPKASS